MLGYVRLIAYIGSCERDRPVVGKACFISFLENGRNIGGTSFVDHLCNVYLSCACNAFASVHCCFVVTCWERADLLALVRDVILYYCYFHMWYTGSGVVLDCVDSCSLSLSYFNQSEGRVLPGET